MNEDNDNEAVENEEKIVNLLDRESTDLEVFAQSETLEAEALEQNGTMRHVHVCILVLMTCALNDALFITICALTNHDNIAHSDHLHSNQ